MARFRYKAAGAGSEVLEGELEAADQQAVVRRLQAQGNVPIRVEPITDDDRAPGRTRRRAGRRRISRDDVSVLTVELSTLLQAGLSVAQALDLLANLAGPGAVSDLVRQIHADVRGGAELSKAMERHPRAFSRFYLNMVRAGEASGKLELVLERLAEFMERSQALRATVISALFYPIILIFMAIASLGVILGVVIPRIAQMFVDAGASLPLATRIVLGLGEFVTRYGWIVALALAGVAVLVHVRLRDPAARLRLHGLILRLPVIGDLAGKYDAARFTRTLGTLMSSGVPLLGALSIARQVVGNEVIARGLVRVAEQARAGQGLARPLLEVDVFPRLAAHLVHVGEQAGNLEDMLLRLAEIYDREVSLAIRRAVDLLGPILILGLGVTIAGLILSVLAGVMGVNELAF